MDLNKKTVSWFFLASGFSALLFEVVWTRQLSIVLGSTVYGSTVILAVYLAAISGGAYFGGKLSQRKTGLLNVAAYLLFATSLLSMASAGLIFNSSRLYYSLYSLVPDSFLAFILDSFLICGLFVFLPVFFLAAVYPLAVKVYQERQVESALSASSLYSLNNLGSAIGALAVGFILLSAVGQKTSALLGALLIFCFSLIFLRSSGRPAGRKTTVFSILFALTAAAVFISDADAYIFSFTKTVLFPDWEAFTEAKEDLRVVFNKEDSEGIVSVYEDDEGVKLLAINGRNEGSTGSDIQNQVLLAALPSAYMPQAKSFLNIGLGTGTTLYYASLNGGYSRLDCLEINPVVARAVDEKFYPNLIIDPRITVYYTDARNFLLLNKLKYDIISSEPSYPFDRSVSHLFTREYFNIVRNHLSPGGVYCQWLPGYMFNEQEVDIFIKTIGAAFRNIDIWKVELSNDYLFIADNKAESKSQTEVISRLGGILAPASIDAEAAVSRLYDKNEIDGIIADPNIPLNTDNLPILEFKAIRNTVLWKQIINRR